MKCHGCEEWAGWIRILERERCLCETSCRRCFSREMEKILRIGGKGERSCCLLSFLSFLGLLISELNRESPGVCGTIQELISRLKKVKIEVAALLYGSYKETREVFVKAALEGILFQVLYGLPCHPFPCDALCRAALHSFKPPGDLIAFFLSFLTSYREEEDKTSLCKNSIASTRSDDGGGEAHRIHSIRYIGHYLATNWKNLYQNCYASPHNSFKEKSDFISLWKEMLRLHSSASYPGFKNFVSNLHLIISASPKPVYFWKKELDCVNRALCYGTTLGLQNEIPGDVSLLAQKLISLSKSKEYYASLASPKTSSPGLAGNLADSEEKKPDYSIGQSLILMHLKAVAILVRDAQCFSSSEESDASSGADSLRNEDLLNIEKSIADILESITEWMRPAFHFHPDATFLSMYMKIFREQDDFLIEGLLCMLDIYVGSKLAEETLNPLTAFNDLAESLSMDHSVFLDFLLSNETCFLLYFLRFLKYLNRGSKIDLVTERYENVFFLLSNLKKSIDKLTDKGLFPYDISPVHTLLKNLIK